MTEKERLKYIEDRRKQRSLEYSGNRPRGSVHIPNNQGKKTSSLGFRTYIAVVLTGGIFTISLFQSETAIKVSNGIKTAIQEEMTDTQIETVKDYIAQIVKDGEITPMSLEAWSNSKMENLPVQIQEEAKEKTVYYPDIGNEP